PFPFNELIPSWNLRLPSGGEYQVELRVGVAAQSPESTIKWSAWYWFGPATPAATTQAKATSHDTFGELRTDTLILNQPCNRAHIRLPWRDPGDAPRRTPFSIDRFTLAISNTTGDKHLWEANRIKPKKWDPPTYTRRLDVPFLSQHVATMEMQG